MTGRDTIRVQLWSYNYDPEPQGIAPLSGMLARALCDLGYEMLVVAAHPHYPEPVWGMRVRPYRERRDGISVLRLPLWPGRGSGLARIRQELTYTLSLASVAPILPEADVLIAVTPSFPALAPAMGFARTRRVPWLMWLQDIATDGAATTGEIEEGTLLKAARAFERCSYKSADSVVVISEAFRQNLLAKGVAAPKIVRIFNPASRLAGAPNDVEALLQRPPRILAMGNIGHSQGLDRIVEAFEADEALAALEATLVIAGGGVAAADTRARIKTNRVEMPGVLFGEDLTPELRGASVGLVSQRGDITEFNLPSKLMNYMAFGIPVLASVNPESETARIVRESRAGWVADARHPEQFAAKASEVLRDKEALIAAGRSGFEFARREFAPSSVALAFDRLIREAVGAPRLGVQQPKGHE